MGAEKHRNDNNYISKCAWLFDRMRNLIIQINTLKRKNHKLATAFDDRRSAAELYDIILENLYTIRLYINKVNDFKKVLSAARPFSGNILVEYFVHLKSAEELALKYGIPLRTFYRRLNKTCKDVLERYELKERST